MAGMIFTYESRKNGWLIEIEGKTIKLWLSDGFSNFTGDFDELNEAYPEVIAELIEKKIITKK